MYIVFKGMIFRQAGGLKSVIEFPSLGSPGSRFLLFALRHELYLGTETLDPLFQAQAWSFNVSRLVPFLDFCLFG